MHESIQKLCEAVDGAHPALSFKFGEKFADYICRIVKVDLEASNNPKIIEDIYSDFKWHRQGE
jgi:hypothetical protein